MLCSIDAPALLWLWKNFENSAGDREEGCAKRHNIGISYNIT